MEKVNFIPEIEHRFKKAYRSYWKLAKGEEGALIIEIKENINEFRNMIPWLEERRDIVTRIMAGQIIRIEEETSNENKAQLKKELLEFEEMLDIINSTIKACQDVITTKWDSKVDGKRFYIQKL